MRRWSYVRRPPSYYSISTSRCYCPNYPCFPLLSTANCDQSLCLSQQFTLSYRLCGTSVCLSCIVDIFFIPSIYLWTNNSFSSRLPINWTSSTTDFCKYWTFNFPSPLLSFFRFVFFFFLRWQHQTFLLSTHSSAPIFPREIESSRVENFYWLLDTTEQNGSVCSTRLTVLTIALSYRHFQTWFRECHCKIYYGQYR